MAGKQNLSPKEIKACEGYLRGLSLRKALLEAGYSSNYCEGNAHLFNWLKRRHICSYIRQRQLQIATAESLDKSELIKVARHIIASDDPKDRAKALELLMRLGVSLDPSQLTKDDVKGINITINQVNKDIDGN
jgi:phage terminase small subunit